MFKTMIRTPVFPILLTVLSLLLVGCDGRSATEKRMDEFRYTADSLAEEVIGRLKNVSKSPKSRPNARAEQVREQEADRGGDGDRPDPNTLEAIVADVVVKIQYIETQDDAQKVDQVLMERVASADGLTSKIKSDFEEALKNALQQTDS